VNILGVVEHGSPFVLGVDARNEVFSMPSPDAQSHGSI